MKRFLPIVVGALTLVACSQPAQVQNVQWQVTNLYTSPEYPSAVPDEVAGLATITFGARSLTGSTGCARFQGVAEYDVEDPSEASTISVKEIVFDPIDEQTCVGKRLYVHNSMVDMLQDATFDIKNEPNGTTKVLSKQVDAVERPGMRLATT
ncbi:META domain-containing protein [Corynebacterium gerontici]|uniref:DUF306 domain-containing protein n=1 Tax=Corynebacterium gerontici TaxID=2079234 RepID=A0A3G6IYG9_9CORY|nr:hypothetical protein [Corynebacterium gerontici]AZA10696.1 hypothetical protein CGERO_01810 [Corynebacterium gerontici]